MKIYDQTRVPDFLKMLKELSSTQIEIGIFGDGEGGETYKAGDPITVLGIAIVHEFGTIIKFKDSDRTVTIPERSFIRAGFDFEKDNIEKRGATLLEGVINLDLSVDVFFETMGQYIVGRIQEYLTDLKDPPNEDSTIKQKGSSNPLIDTGRLRQAITFKVVRK